MWPAPVVVGDPLRQYSPQVRPAERNQVIQAFAAHGSDQTFTVSIRCRRSAGALQHFDGGWPLPPAAPGFVALCAFEILRFAQNDKEG